VEHPVEFDANVSTFKTDNMKNEKFVKFLTFGLPGLTKKGMGV
jgi:hypothetical protein